MIDIQKAILRYVMINNLIILVIGIIFTFFFIRWSKKTITDPIRMIEEKVVSFAETSHGQQDPKALVLDIPPLGTRNELESLASAVVKLSKDMRDYLVNALDARDAAYAAQKRANELSRQVTKDSLTGISNRHAYDAYVEKLKKRIELENFTSFAIAKVDMNYLKKINDEFGHDKGNLAIIRLCKIVCNTFKHSPVFRLGGDEFAVIVINEDYEYIDERMKEFKKIMEDLEKDGSLSPWEKVSAAVGWADYDPDKDNGIDGTFRRADERMYENKKEMKAQRV